MAKIKMPKQKSIATDRFWPCQSNGSDHVSPLALTIQQGPARCFTRCSCSGTIFFGRRFTPEHGYTAAQVQAMGLMIS